MDKHEIEADHHHDRMMEQADIKQAQYETSALSQMSDYESVEAALACIANDLHNYTGEIAALLSDRKYMAEPKTELEKAVYKELIGINEFQD